MDFECDPPKEWRVTGLPGWSGSTNRSGNDWPWHMKREGDGPAVTITGIASSEDEAKRAMVNAYERISYAFCTESPEDMPHALSALLAAADGMRDAEQGLDWPREDYEQTAVFARRVLSVVPRMTVGSQIPTEAKMELERDEWQAKAEAFGQKAHQLQQRQHMLGERIQAIAVAWRNVGDSRGMSPQEIESVSRAIEEAALAALRGNL